MASRSRHLDEAQRFRRLAERLAAGAADESAELQWAIVLAFYSGLHYVEAFFADLGLHSIDHHDRATLLADANVGFPDDAKDAYAQLKQWSTQARYELRRFKAAQVKMALEIHLQAVGAAAGAPS